MTAKDLLSSLLKNGKELPERRARIGSGEGLSEADIGVHRSKTEVDQYRLLRLAGVTSLQGHLFKRPGPAAEINFDEVYGKPDMVDAA